MTTHGDIPVNGELHENRDPEVAEHLVHVAVLLFLCVFGSRLQAAVSISFARKVHSFVRRFIPAVRMLDAICMPDLEPNGSCFKPTNQLVPAASMAPEVFEWQLVRDRVPGLPMFWHERYDLLEIAHDVPDRGFRAFHEVAIELERSSATGFMP